MKQSQGSLYTVHRGARIRDLRRYLRDRAATGETFVVRATEQGSSRESAKKKLIKAIQALAGEVSMLPMTRDRRTLEIVINPRMNEAVSFWVPPKRGEQESYALVEDDSGELQAIPVQSDALAR